MYSNRFVLLPGETWADVWFALIVHPVFLFMALCFLASALLCTALVYRWGIHKNHLAMRVVVLWSFTQWIITASTFTHFGLLHAWELHFVSEGMGFIYLLLAYLNIELLRVLKWTTL